MWMLRSNDPYKKSWKEGTSSTKGDALWRHQTWGQQRWDAQDWTKTGQEEAEEDDVEQEEEEEVYDEHGKLIQKEKY
eukprot:14544454-Heterocapsa_arctica.AAC.1